MYNIPGKELGLNLAAAHSLGIVFEDWPFSVEETDKSVEALNKTFPNFKWEAGIPTDSGDYRVGVEPQKPSGKLTDQAELSADEAEKIVTLVNELKFTFEKLNSIQMSLGVSFPLYRWKIVSGIWGNRLSCSQLDR